MIKAVIVILTIAVYMNNVTAETCRDNSDCSLESCSWGSHVECVRGICTCVDFCSNEDATCGGRLDCVQNAHEHDCACDQAWHCIDNHCACGYPIIPS